MNTKRSILISGDILSIAVLTVIGFATHGEAGTSFILRMGATFFPLVAAWCLSAPRLGLFDEEAAADPKMLWRIIPAMILAAPLAVMLRAALLHSAGQPIFALVLGGMNALGMLVWRGIYALNVKRSKKASAD